MNNDFCPDKKWPYADFRYPIWVCVSRKKGVFISSEDEQCEPGVVKICEISPDYESSTYNAITNSSELAEVGLRILTAIEGGDDDTADSLIYDASMIIYEMTREADEVKIWPIKLMWHDLRKFCRKLDLSPEDAANKFISKCIEDNFWYYVRSSNRYLSHKIKLLPVQEMRECIIRYITEGSEFVDYEF